MNQIAQAEIARSLRAHKANQRALNIAASISVGLQIKQHGIEVIEVIGSGEEGCNIEAVMTWVTNQVNQRDLAEGNYSTRQLRGELKRQLTDWLEYREL